MCYIVHVMSFVRLCECAESQSPCENLSKMGTAKGFLMICQRQNKLGEIGLIREPQHYVTVLELNM